MIDQDLYRKEYLVTVCTNTGMVYKYYVFTNKRANAKRHVYNHISRETNIMEGVDRLDITVKPYNGGAPAIFKHHSFRILSRHLKNILAKYCITIRFKIENIYKFALR